MKELRNKSSILALLLTLPVTLMATSFYVAPNGTSGGTGSQASPWDLQTALSQPAAVRPGDTIWLRGGTYNGTFTSTLNGTSSAPIVVRQYPSERATLNGSVSAPSVLIINGTWTWYWGFEVTCSDPNRYVSRAEGVSVYAANNRFINLVVHDTGEGFGFWTPAVDSTIYGSLIYYNGFEQSDRGHGHNIYSQNQTGTKHILDNILFKSFSEGIQIYGSSNAYLDNYDIQGNMFFDHGVPSLTGGAKDNILLGGGRVAQNASIINNYTYFSPGANGRNDVGYGSGCNNATLTGNYFAQYQALNLNCSNVTMTGNSFYGSIAGFTPSQFPSNTYGASHPSGLSVFVRPNTYEPGRANIAVFNWDRLNAVPVNLSTVLTPGQSYEVRDAQNFYGAPVASGVYAGGNINIPAALTQISPTVGLFPVPPVHTLSEFNIYVVLPASGGGTPTNQAPVVSAGSNQTITLPSSATLSGTASDDGLPNNTLTVTWSKVSGPGTVTFSAVNAAQSTATFSAAGTYILQLTATDGALSANSQVTLTVNPQGTPGTNTAQFLTTDAATQGNWQGVYGSDGAIVINDGANIPAYATLTATGPNAYTWVASTTAIQALAKMSGSGRIAATWFSNTGFSMDLNMTDGSSHKLAIYCLDWDGAGSRGQKIDVLDAQTGAVLDSRTVGSFANGVYLVWNLSGHVRIQVTRTAGANAVISGLFWGGAGAPVNQAPVVSAGVNQTITLPSAATLNGTVSDDGLPSNALSQNWSVVSGPGSVTFGSATSAATTATFSASGTYVLQLTASDGALTRSSQVTIIVNPSAPTAPVISQIAVSSITTTSATISWTTNVASSSEVAYGTSTGLGSTSGVNSALVTAHSVTLNSLTPGTTYFYQVKSAASGGPLATSSVLSFATGSVVGSSAAQFVSADTTTQGNWQGIYGSEGANVINDAANLPGYATVTPSGQLAYTWASTSSLPQALNRLSGSGRIAATWYTNASMSFDMNLTGGTHRFAIYCLDWDGVNSRAERFDILDAATNTVLDTRTLGSFSNGVYVVWNLTGHVIIRVTRTSGANAVISGMFWGGAGTPTNQAPVVSAGSNQTTTALSTTLSGSATDDGLPSNTVTLGWSKVSGPGTVSFGSVSTAQTTVTFGSTGVYVLQLSASDGALTSSSQVTVTVNPAGTGTNSAQFVSTDTTTQGNWQGVYGSSGANVINDASNPAAYATVTASGQQAYTWTPTSTLPQALARLSGSGRIAATWYSNTSMSIDVNVTDGNSHRFSIYCLDWDGANGRAQRFDVLDAATNTILDTRMATAFSNGAYLTWNVTGHVIIRITRTSGANAVISGLFWGP